MDFKLENVLVSLHSLKTMGLGTFGASAPLFLRNGELLGHSPIHICSFLPPLQTHTWHFHRLLCTVVRWQCVGQSPGNCKQCLAVEMSRKKIEIQNYMYCHYPYICSQCVLVCCQCFHMFFHNIHSYVVSVSTCVINVSIFFYNCRWRNNLEIFKRKIFEYKNILHTRFLVEFVLLDL